MPSGYGFNDIGRSGDLKQSYLNLANRANVFNSANKIALSQERVRENMVTKRLEEDKNYKLNSLKGLFVQSGDDLNTASLKANSFFSRIDGASSTQELNSVYDELSQIRDKAALNNRVFYKGDKDAGLLIDSLQGLAKSATNLVGTLGAGLSELTGGFLTTEISKTKNNLKEELKKSNPSTEALTSYFKGSDETDFFNTIKGHINQNKNAQFGNNYLNKVGDVATLKNQLQSAINNPNKRAGLLDLKNSYLDNEFTTKGSDFYREGEEAQSFQKRAKDTVNTQKGMYVEERYFNYDLENSALGSLKNTLNKKLNDTWNKFVKNEKGQWVRDEKALKDIRDSLSLIDQRQSQLNEVYSVNKNEKTWDRIFTKGREGSYLGALGTGIKPLMSKLSEDLGLSDDFENTIEQKALYLPKQVDYDREGNAVMSNQLFYTKKDGSSGVNGEAVLELGLQQVGQMLPTIILSEVGGAALGRLGAAASTAEAGIAAGTLSKTALSEVSALSRAANTFSKGYDRFNKLGVAGIEFKLADRLSTTINVFATTYPMIEAEERKYGGNYKERAVWKTSIEASVEGAGFPDVGALKMRPMQTSMIGDAARAAGKTIKEIPFTDRLRMYYNTSKEFGKLTFKQNVTESLEEEMSLIGNYLYESMNSEEFKDREQTRLNAESLTDTFVDSFVGGLLYSSGTTSFGVYKFTRNDNLQQIADWNAANNPELMKAKIAEMHTTGKLTDEQTSKAINRVNELHGVLKSAFGLTQLKDAKARLEDKDEQFQYFQNIVKKADLIGLDFDSMTDEEKELFADKRKKEKISRKTGKRIDEIKVELAQLKLNENNATEDDQKKVEVLNEELSKLSFIKKGIFNKSTLSTEQINYLQEKELLPEEKPLSKEDFDKEIAAIDMSILKTSKRIDRYVNLSKEEKQKLLDSSYDEQIEAIGLVNSPNKILNSFNQVSSLLDEYEKTGKDFEELDKKNAERLKAAYAKRFEDLVNVSNERGYNAVEESLLAIDAQAFLENNDLSGLLALNDTILEEREFMDNSFVEQLNAKNYILYTAMMNKVNKMSSEERIDFLAEFLDKNSHKTVIPTFEVKALNEVFSKSDKVKVEFTEEELSAARNKMLESRGKQRANALVNKGVVVEDSNLSPEEKADKENFEKQVKESLEIEKNETVDESGKNSYEDHINTNYAKQKAASQKLDGDKWRSHFVNFFVNQIGNYFGRNVAAFTQGKKLSTQLFLGEITLKEFNTAWDSFGRAINVSLAKTKPGSREEKNLKEKWEVLRLFKSYINKLYNEDLPEGFELKQKPADAAKEKKADEAKEVIVEDTVAAKRHEEFLLKAETRKERLLTLATPARSNAYELIEGVKESDPVNLRRLRALDELAQTPDAKMRLMTKQEYIRQYLKLKYPDSTPEQIAASLQTIVDVFTDLKQSEGKLTPEEVESRLNQIYDIVGDAFFSQREIAYYLKNPNNFLENNKPLMIAVNNEGIILFENYPLELSVYGKEEPSQRTSDALEELNITSEDIKERHKNNKISLNLIQETIEKNPSLTFDLPFEVTAGVVPTKEAEVKGLGLKYEPIISLDFDAMGIDANQLTASNLVVASNVRETIFGKQFIFYPGRVYFNFNGNPIQLNNLQMDPLEAQALTEIIFRSADAAQNLEDFPYFRKAENFAKYLKDLINQTNPDNRLYFYANPNFGKPGESPIIVKQREVVDGKKVYTTLDFKQTLAQLSKTYYKVDKEALSKNEIMPRFFMGEEGVDLNEENFYAQYIFQTHEMPIVEGKPYGLVNKTVLLEEKELQEVGKKLGAKTIPQRPTPPAQPQGVQVVPKGTPQQTTPTSSPTRNEVDKDGYTIIHSDNNNESLVTMHFPSREQSIKILKENNVNPKYIVELEKMTDAEYESEIKSLGQLPFPNPDIRDSKKQPKPVTSEGTLQSSNNDIILIEIVPGVIRAYGLVTPENGQFVLKFNFNRTRLTTSEDEDVQDTTKKLAVDKKVGVKVLKQMEPEVELMSIDELPDTIEESIPTPVPVLPTSELDIKKADIEKRRGAELYRNENKLQLNVNLGENPTETALKKQKEVDKYNKVVQERIDKVNAKYDAELAREFYKEIKSGKLVTEMTPIEQQIANKYITAELKASVDAELAALETSQPSTSPATQAASIVAEEFTEPVDQTQAEDAAETCKLGKSKVNKTPTAAPKQGPSKRVIDFNNRLTR